MDIKLLDISDRSFINERLSKYPPDISELTFSNLYFWRHGRPVLYAAVHDMLVFFIREGGGDGSGLTMFGTPAGVSDPGELMKELRGRIQRCVRISLPFAEYLGAAGFTAEEDRDNDDYVYLVADLASLEGRKYSKKRNHIKNCLNEYDCRYEIISSSIIGECLSLQKEWCNIKGCDINPGLYHENQAIADAFANYDDFRLIGGAIRVNGAIQAYALGERLNADTAVCHFEKANTDFIGLNQLITHWFAKYSLEGYTYVNREQDLGNPGLRQAKLSYYPHHMINKFIVRL